MTNSVSYLELTPKEKKEFVAMVVLARKMELMKREQIPAFLTIVQNQFRLLVRRF